MSPQNALSYHLFRIFKRNMNKYCNIFLLTQRYQVEPLHTDREALLGSKCLALLISDVKNSNTIQEDL